MTSAHRQTSTWARLKKTFERVAIAAEIDPRIEDRQRIDALETRLLAIETQLGTVSSAPLVRD